MRVSKRYIVFLGVVTLLTACKSNQPESESNPYISRTGAGISEEQDSAETESVIDDGLKHISYLDDKLPMQTIEELKNNSTLILIGTIEKKEETVYEVFVEDDLKEKLENESAEKIEYCDIYTYYTIKPDKVLSGEEIGDIVYKCRSGQIDNFIVDEPIPIKESEQYLFVLTLDAKEKSVYKNAVGFNAVAKIENEEIVKNAIVGKCFSAGMEVDEIEKAFSET